MRDARTIQQTREAVSVIVSAFDLYHRANADGHISLVEWGSFVTLFPEVWRAAQQAAEIPRELADIDGTEADELIAFIAKAINPTITTNDMRLKIDKILVAFHALADALAQWRGVNPPKAEVAS